MSVTNQDQQWDYVGDGINATFGFDNIIYAAADIDVFATGVKKLLVTDYAVTGVGAAGGGSVVFVTPPAAGIAVALRSNIPETQATQFPPGSPFPGTAISGALDRATRLVQQARWRGARSLVLAESDAQASLGALPPKTVRLNGGLGSYLGFDGVNGDPTCLALPIGTSQVSAALAPVIAAATVAVARGLLGSTALGDALFTAASALVARQLVQVPFSASRKPVASPYASVAGDVGFVISSESAGGALVTNLLAGATYGVGACLTFVRSSNSHTVNTNGADRIQGFNGTANFAAIAMTAEDGYFTIMWDGALWKLIDASPGVRDLAGGLPAAGSLRSHFSGFQAVWNSNTEIDTAPGAVIDSSFAVLIKLGAKACKSSAAFAVGLGAVGAPIGGLDSGAVAINTWYNVFTIRRPDTGAVDVCYSVNAFNVGPNFGAGRIPAAFTQWQFLYSFLTDGAGLIVQFINNTDDFFWKTIANDVNAAALGTTATNFTVRVPPGRQTRVYWQAGIVGPAGNKCGARIYDPNLADVVLTGAGTDAFVSVGTVAVGATALRASGFGTSYCNTSQNLRAVADQAGSALCLGAVGWNESARRAA